ncbi:MAG: bifunctional 4-hydroxy-2-oxoglutarate aldolase/2-dehydro-3-deoxy-phosphogluconate aldolase [Agarilytica sp.]
MPKTIEEIMTHCPIIPVIVINKMEDAIPLAKALVNGGLKVLEITLRSEHGLNAITAIKKEVPEAIVGAGTILNSDDFNKSVDAGSEFIVSPGTSDALLATARQSDIPLLPGISTPSEAITALDSGIQHMKFFPAEAAGGIAMLKAIAGPLPHIKFCPTGGVNISNVKDYLALDNVLCVGGTWMLDKSAIQSGNWTQIQESARAAAWAAG